MRAVLFALIFFPGWASADEAADRAAVEKTISALNTWPANPSLFTADFDDHGALRRSAIAGICPTVWWETCGIATAPETGQVVISKEPWGEATVVFPGWAVGMRVPIIVKRIRFLTPDVAMVDAVSTRRLLIVMRREGTDWKIASIRELADQ